jgi:hypothetical protein
MRAVLRVQQRPPRTYGVSRSPICSSTVVAVDQKNRHRFVRTMGSNCGGPTVRGDGRRTLRLEKLLAGSTITRSNFQSNTNVEPVGAPNECNRTTVQARNRVTGRTHPRGS